MDERVVTLLVNSRSEGLPRRVKRASNTTVRSPSVTLREGTNTTEASAVASLWIALLVPAGSGVRNVDFLFRLLRSRGWFVRCEGDSGLGLYCLFWGRWSSGSDGISSINLDSDFSELIEGLFSGRVDGENHSFATVSASTLLAIPPSGLLLLDDVLPSWSRNNSVVKIWHETRVLTTLEPVARLCESGLGNRVILLLEDEMDGISNLGLDMGWGVNQSGITSNYDSVNLLSFWWRGHIHNVWWRSFNWWWHFVSWGRGMLSWWWHLMSWRRSVLDWWLLNVCWFSILLGWGFIGNCPCSLLHWIGSWCSIAPSLLLVVVFLLAMTPLAVISSHDGGGEKSDCGDEPHFV